MLAGIALPYKSLGLGLFCSGCLETSLRCLVEKFPNKNFRDSPWLDVDSLLAAFRHL